jgi:acyl-CoA reductase-like NAD-dependent aldehyde dehydrogenase
LQVETLHDVRTGEPVAEVSQATSGMISRDQLRAAENQRALGKFTVAELLEIGRKAARYFAEDTLPLGDTPQTPEAYLDQLAATTGMPKVMGQANMAKIVKNLDEMEAILGGLTRGLDLSVLDGGWGTQDGRKLSYLRLTDALGAILPNNSPGVHSLWLPAIPLKVPLVLKPGSTEPWTPYRIIQAFLKAGAPRQAFSFYPADRGSAMTVLQKTGRSMIFGDQSTVEKYADDARVQPHGPGWSKILLGPDAAERWAEYVEMVAHSVAANGGRSCINASGWWLAGATGLTDTTRSREAAQALAERLVGLEARPLDDPRAELSAMAQPAVAHKISEIIDYQLQQPGAEDLTAALRGTPRVAEAGGCTFLLPTVIHITDPAHPLAQAEYGFPFVTVAEAPADTFFETLGPTLVGTVVTEDAEFRQRALTCPHIDRLNLGAIPTPVISWDQPHEGNMFDHLYHQRAFQVA